MNYRFFEINRRCKYLKRRQIHALVVEETNCVINLNTLNKLLRNILKDKLVEKYKKASTLGINVE